MTSRVIDAAYEDDVGGRRTMLDPNGLKEIN